MREYTAVNKSRGRIGFTDTESLAVNLADLRGPQTLPKTNQGSRAAAARRLLRLKP